jgi:aminopeptidase-like protein
VPGTIGSLTWLSLNRGSLDRVHGGLVLTGLGDAGGFTFKRSRHGDAHMDELVIQALRDHGGNWELRDFSPYGYDERQYCSPGFNLAVGRLSRTPFGEYPQYHTSGDGPDFVHAKQLEDALALTKRIVDYLEGDGRWMNLSPYGEPQLGRRGLYAAVGGTNPDESRMALLWVLNLSDGSSSLLDVASRSGLSMTAIIEAAGRLREAGLLDAVKEGLGDGEDEAN